MEAHDFLGCFLCLPPGASGKACSSDRNFGWLARMKDMAHQATGKSVLQMRKRGRRVWGDS